MRAPTPTIAASRRRGCGSRARRITRCGSPTIAWLAGRLEPNLREIDPAVPGAHVLHALVDEALRRVGNDARDRPRLVERGGELGREPRALGRIPRGAHRVEHAIDAR